MLSGSLADRGRTWRHGLPRQDRKRVVLLQHSSQPSGMASPARGRAALRANGSRRTLTPVAAGALVLCASLAAAPVQAQTQPDASLPGTQSAPLTLQSSPWLDEKVPPTAAGQNTTIIHANRIDGQMDYELTATGDAELRQPGSVIKSETLHYHQPTDTVTATGKVYINREGNVYRGDRLQLQMDSFQGGFDNVSYSILQTGGTGTASRIEFLDDQHSVAHNGIYTTCRADTRKPGESNPAWYVRGKRLLIDTEQDEGYVEDGALVFYGVPIVPLPGGVGFPLSEKRRSGLLPPTVSYSSTSGLEYAQPYYVDIAPNRDATLTPTIIGKRGIDLYGQFRYLENSYSGQIDANYMPSDKLRDMERWRYQLAHTQAIPTTNWGTFGLNLDMRRVSDDNYWRDFRDMSQSYTNLTERVLPSTATLSWGLGHWSAYVTHQRWQTLQEPDIIIPPFDKLPQAHARYARTDLNGFDLSLDLDVTRFKSRPELTGYPNGTRGYAVGQLSYPWIRPWGYVTPSLQLHATQYQTDSPMTNGATSASRVLPTVTVDSGLVFERDTTLFGRKVQQTLEPRLFYAYTPYKDQSFLPVYDSSLKDFNLASIFSANPFSGDDRIADAQAVTAGLTSRLYDANDGAELARFTIAGRKQFKTRQVTLNPADKPNEFSFSNLLFDGNIQWNPKWNARASVQWDPESKRSIRSVVGASYSPGPYRTISANYRLQRGVSEQVDVGWQWPLNDLWGDKGEDRGPGLGQGPGRWYSVGRVYYSLTDRRVVDSILGLEYDACCWIGRIALRRQQTQALPVVKMDNKIMFQLEFVGLSRIGSSPIRTFRENIPNYMLLRDRTVERSRFADYN